MESFSFWALRALALAAATEESLFVFLNEEPRFGLEAAGEVGTSSALPLATSPRETVPGDEERFAIALSEARGLADLDRPVAGKILDGGDNDEKDGRADATAPASVATERCEVG